VTTTVEHPEWTTGTALRELVRLALPIVAMTVSRMLMTFVDFVMVSQLGTEAQAAISPATMFVFVLGCLGLGIATATQTLSPRPWAAASPARPAATRGKACTSPWRWG
jgi:Na+-driven multidrug efflux pump